LIFVLRAIAFGRNAGKERQISVIIYTVH